MKNMKKKNNKGFFKGLVTGLLILILIIGAKKVIPASATEKPAGSVTATDVATETETTTETTETTTAAPQSNGGKRSTTTAPSNDEVEADDGEYPTWDWDVSFDDTPSDSEDNSSDSVPSEPEVEAEAVDIPYVAPLGEMSWVWLQEVNGMAYMQNRPFTDGSGRHLTFEEATEICGGISQAEFWQLSEDLLIETHTNVVFSQPQKGKFISLRKVYDPDTGNVTAF